MKLIPESQRLQDYLEKIPPVIDFSTPHLSAKIAWIEAHASTPLQKAELAFEIARDEISHSFDTRKHFVSITAEDTLKTGDGICFAKAHLLAGLLRGLKIPAGFCYQRVLRKGTVASGYALHGLNAVYLNETGWFRLDPRGNKTGIDAQFSPLEEKLAYTIHPDLGEIDYPNIFTHPLPAVINAMRTSQDTGELFYKRPVAL